MSAGVVIVNYNCAGFALDAALSAVGDGAACVIIVDNASTDCSMAFFRKALASGDSYPKQARFVPPAPVFANLADISTQVVSDNNDVGKTAVVLTIVESSENRGFAAGCNIGLKRLMADGALDVFIMLNPDAVLAKGSIAAFTQRLSDPQAGLCGASVLRYDAPHGAQAFAGARMNPFTLLGDNLGAGLQLEEAPPTDFVESRLSYPLGAAMACRRDYIETAGYLDERYFLYYEEADWVRAGAARFKPVWARDAVVYHRHGAVAGSRLGDGGRSPGADYHMARSRILYAIKWRPVLTPFLMAGGAVQAIRRLLRGRKNQAKAVLTGSLPGAPWRKA